MTEISVSELKRGIEVDFPSRNGVIKAIRFKNEYFELYNIKTGVVDYRYRDLKRLVMHTNRIFRIKDKAVE
jgi:hypothetical protein